MLHRQDIPISVMKIGFHWPLYEVYAKEWLERIWVIQEAALASSAVVLLGKLQFDWDAIGDAALWLYHRQFPDAAY
jgi:hypothetical protein